MPPAVDAEYRCHPDSICPSTRTRTVPPGVAEGGSTWTRQATYSCFCARAQDQAISRKRDASLTATLIALLRIGRCSSRKASPRLLKNLVSRFPGLTAKLFLDKLIDLAID